MKLITRCIPIGVALVVGGLVSGWPPLKFRDLSGSDFASRFTTIVFFSLLIERTIEILMSIWRSEESNKREAEVRRLVSAGTSPTDASLIDAQTRLIQYKAETLQWTMPFGFALGLLISGFGVRVLSEFVDHESITGEGQRLWFSRIDVLFTGALLAGGADPIHKILDILRKFSESTAAKAAGTKS